MFSFFRKSRWLFLIVSVNLFLGGLVAMTSAALQADTPLFDPLPGLSTQSQLSQTGVLRQRPVEINFGVIAPGGAFAPQNATVNLLSLNLFPDVTLVAEPISITPHELTQDGFVWQGRVRGQPATSEVILVAGDGQMTGYVRTADRFYHIAYAGGSSYLVREIDERVFDSRPHTPPLPVGIEPPPAGFMAPSAVTDTFSIIDYMVVYTPRARNEFGGVTATQNAIQLAVAAANQVLINSDVAARLRLVHTALVDYDELNDSTDDDNIPYNGEDLDDLRRTNDGRMDEVHTLRNTYGADIVTLVTVSHATAKYCGIGYQMQGGVPNPNFAPWAFNAVVADCLPGGRTLIHEVGHNMGAAHDIANQPDGGLLNDSFGYIAPAGEFRTIMAYTSQCPANTPCVGIAYFSNKNRTFGGVPLGTNNANNVQALNTSAPVVSGFRGAANSGISPTATPTGPTLTPTPIWQGGTPIATPTAAPPAMCDVNIADGDTAGLINAINTANSNGSGQDRICLAQNGTYTVSAPFAGNPASYGSTGFPAITTPVNIIGYGATIRRTGSTALRFFFVANGGDLSLSWLTLENGFAPTTSVSGGNRDGGAIYVYGGGTLVMLRSIMQANRARDFGGAILSFGQTYLYESTFTGNAAYGGGVIFSWGSLLATGVHFTENSAEAGSVLYNYDTGTATIGSSCLVNNSLTTIYDDTPGTPVIATNNWWGSSRGPSVENDIEAGRGDLVSLGVNYTPYHLRPLALCPLPVYAPVLVSPANNAFTNNTTPLLTWNPHDGAIEYEVEIAEDIDFVNGTQVFLTDESSYTLPALADGLYFWRVRMDNGATLSEWSAVRRFTVDTVPPAVPALTAPANNAETTSVRPALTWASAAGAARYQVAFGADDPPPAVGLFTATSYTPSIDLPIGAYFWRVRAQDAAGNWSDWSVTRSFAVISPPGIVPEVVYYQTATPTLAWSPINWATGYQLQVSANPQFNPLLVDNSTLTLNQQQFTIPALENGRYYWRVRARRPNGTWAGWSAVSSFTIAVSP